MASEYQTFNNYFFPIVFEKESYNELVFCSVVTGIRWKVVNEIIYMQIQEGKFENIISVDPETVHWKDIETHGRDENVITLNETQRAVILDDSILQVRSYVTGMGKEIHQFSNEKNMKLK